MTIRLVLLMKSLSLMLALTSVLSTLSCPTLLFGAENPEETVHEVAEPSVQEFTKERKQQRWAAFPIIASSPETGLMLGGMLFHFFPTGKPEQQASTIDLMAYGTTEGQYAISLAPNIFFDNGSYRLNATLIGNFWQANYYRIGNKSPDVYEEFDSTNYGVYLTFEARYFEGVILNLIGVYENTDMDIQTGGMLASDMVFGWEDGEYTGAGLALGYDTRNNTNAPSKGMLARYENMTYNQDFGSTLDFKIQTLDLRYYTPASLIKDSVIALAAQIKSTSDDVPFRFLASPDGTYILRGIENGRYKDKKMASLQTEYRFPVKGNFSGTVFAEFAQVAEDFGDMELNETKSSIGCGIRYALNPEQRFNIRGDVAWVDDGIGMIINVREAF
ncbi:BamA/TamA family outer membrane protein [Thermodesulfobacteriota bacterium]